jgi:hypothetical protein
MELETPPRWTTVMLLFWIMLLLPWFWLAGLSGLAFDAGKTLEAYVVVGSVWTYPVSVLIAAILSRKQAWLVFLPILNFLTLLLSSALH